MRHTILGITMTAAAALVLALALSPATGDETTAGPVEEKPPVTKTNQSATADLEAAEGMDELDGTAAFVRTERGLRVTLQVTDAPPGRHAVHIHETGKCEKPGFASAGSHFNPEGDRHGLPSQPDEERHLGDLGNMIVAPDGKGHLSQILTEPTLEKGGEKSFLGRAIIVHAEADEGTEPAGDAGSRIACGVIQLDGTSAIPTKEEAPKAPPKK